MKNRRVRLALVVVLWAALAAYGVRTWREVARRLAVERACEAIATGDDEEALRASESLLGRDAPGLRAVECRALAFLAAERFGEAAALLDEAVADTGDWLPSPPLVMVLAAEHRNAGRLRKAADLLRRATAAYPDDADLLFFELDARSEVEDETDVLLEMERRLPSAGKAAPILRVRLAQRWSERREFERAGKLFGDAPPAGGPEIVDEWFRARTSYFGAAGETDEVAETCRAWVEAGGHPLDVMAWQALTISIYQLFDPDFPLIERMEEVLARRRELPDPSMAEKVYYRLIASLVLAGRHEKALAYLDEASREFDLRITREDVLRSAEQVTRRSLEPGERRGTLRFTTELSGTLLLSAEGDPVDRDFQAFDFEDAGGSSGARHGVREVERPVGAFPVRWVFRGEDGRTAASGTVWPVPGRRIEVAVEARRGVDPPRTAAAPSGPGRPADGRRRVFVVIADCGDWRLVQYLRARGDLPVIDALVESGYRGVLASRPPYTAVALDTLVRPEKKRTVSPLEFLHQLGTEIGANWFVGKNPLEELGWLLPETPTIFSTVGAGAHTAVNLLYSVGDVRGGYHGEMVGPEGRIRSFPHWRTGRSLTTGERQFFESPGELRESWVEEVAAAFDAGLQAMEHPEVDLLLLRIAPFDTLTHASFSAVSESGQDDGRHALYDIYRYADHRLGEMYESIDGDDVLIVMSDHGIRTSTEHDWRSVFVAAGEPVPHGRFAGTPSLGGVPRLVAELMGVETSWPWGGIEIWDDK